MLTPSDLKSVRLALGLSQHRLAERLGVPQATISRWEAGVFPIERDLLLWLALCHVAGQAQSAEAAALLDAIRVREIGPTR